MLLKAGLIELADAERPRPREAVPGGREGLPRRRRSCSPPAARSDLQAAMIDQVQRAHSLYSAAGAFRGAQLELKLSMERAIELMSAFLTAARDVEDEEADAVVLTMFAHPPAGSD